MSAEDVSTKPLPEDQVAPKGEGAAGSPNQRFPIHVGHPFRLSLALPCSPALPVILALNAPARRCELTKLGRPPRETAQSNAQTALRWWSY